VCLDHVSHQQHDAFGLRAGEPSMIREQSIASDVEPAISPGLLGLASSCFVGGLDEAAESLVRHAATAAGGYACLCNVHVLTEALHDASILDAVEGAAFRFPDGEPVAWLLRRLGFQTAHRIGGPDLFPRVVERGRSIGLRHVFLGSTEPTLARLQRTMVDRYPGAEVVGALSLPFADEPDVEAALVGTVRDVRAQIVWVALGAPKQELWMARAAPRMPDVTFVGIGAAFDFHAGTKRRAPLAMQRLGLEWLHRLASEPRRLGVRYVRSNTEFMIRTGFELGHRRLRSHGRRAGT
jgi:N-acetylglucosaminyldiphosphoundecaprenol N-acetyl-beta-D-mannosaminyltransferase